MEENKILAKHVLEVFDKIASGFAHWRAKPWPEVSQAVSAYLSKARVIVDCGCGTGRDSTPLLEKGAEVIGIDISLGMLCEFKKRAKSKMNDSYSRLHLLQADMRRIPLRSTTVDAALCIASLHHVPRKEWRKQALKEIFRVLRPGGILVLTVWSLLQPKLLFRALLHYLTRPECKEFGDTLVPWKKKNTIVYRFYHLMTKKEVSRLVEESGFRILVSSSPRKKYRVIPRNYLLVAVKE